MDIIGQVEKNLLVQLYTADMNILLLQFIQMVMPNAYNYIMMLTLYLPSILRCPFLLPSLEGSKVLIMSKHLSFVTLVI